MGVVLVISACVGLGWMRIKKRGWQVVARSEVVSVSADGYRCKGTPLRFADVIYERYQTSGSALIGVF